MLLMVHLGPLWDIQSHKESIGSIINTDIHAEGSLCSVDYITHHATQGESA